MDTFRALAINMASQDKEMKVFDWSKAAKIIKDRDAKDASAGLSEDWFWTGGAIFEDGKPLGREDSYTHLASTWATPVLEIDGEHIECYLMESAAHGWNASTFWPDEAKAILGETNPK